MNNPLSDDPEYDLYPYPAGCTGWRLWKMLPEGTSRQQYLEAFDRRNLLRAREWDLKKAREAAEALLPELDGRLVVVLGTGVRAALGLPGSEPLEMLKTFASVGRRKVTFDWIPFPHPSGRNHWFNRPANRARAAEVLRRLMDGKSATEEDFSLSGGL
ncbi:MAG: hypothetical protein Q7T33_14380 [Dehalococcoidia bacterium]|nr:hypothetical protein [Dehalococcoidia bacterium]